MATSTDDFFCSRLDQMIELRHPLAVLASRMPWQDFESSLAHSFARAAKAGKQIEGIDLWRWCSSAQRWRRLQSRAPAPASAFDGLAPVLEARV